MRTIPSRFQYFVIAVSCLLAIWLLPGLLSTAIEAAKSLPWLRGMRSGILASFFIVLGIFLLRSNAARNGFQATALPERAGLLQPGQLVFAASFLSFVAFLHVAFALNDAYLLWQMDGRRFEYLVRQQSIWFPFHFGYTNDFFHSLGNIWYPLNMKLDPGFLLATDSGGLLDRQLSYLIFSVELYLSTFLLGAVLRQGVVISSLAGWGMVLLTMPLFGLPAIYPILAMAPNYPISQTILILCMFRMVGRTRDAYSAALSAVMALLVAHAALAHPTAIVLMVPTLLIFSASILFASDSRREMHVKLIGAASAIAVLVLLDFPRYLIGIFQYTAPYYFSSELYNDRAFHYFVSIVFQTGFTGMALFFLALIGAALTARFGEKLERMFAIGLLAAIAILIGAGALTVGLYDSWRGPSPLYFEFFLWPVYAIFAAATFKALYHPAKVLFERIAGTDLKARLGRLHALYLVAILLLCVPWALLMRSNPQLAPSPSTFAIAETRIVSTLRREVGLRPGSPFRGRVATLTGQNIDRPVHWHDLNGRDVELLARSSNSHQSIGLWWFGIPTLLELSSLITPPFFLITREFLERPGDLQMRNAVLLRRYDPRILRALGVRYVITDAPIEGDAVLRLHEKMPTGAEHYLYEVKGANLGHYSPTRVDVIEDVGRTMAALGNPAFDFTRTVVLEAPVQAELVTARSSQVHVEPGYLRLIATSEETSLLVLPFEFSHCLTLESKDGGDGGGRLVRANLLQAGILFTRRLDATLTYFTGPFLNAGCRMQDKTDMDKLNIRQFRRNIVMPPSRFPGLQ